MQFSDLDRREFIKLSAAGMCMAGLPSAVFAAASTNKPIQRNSAGIPVRALGKTGIDVSILCMGGHHIGRIKNDREAVDFVRYGIDHGITFIDNAWEYHHGRSEKIVGQALQDGYRDKVFLMTKVHGRDKEKARQQIDESLNRLGVDHVDLLQLHEVIYEDDPERIFAHNGAMEAVEEAKQSGKTRFVGFTGHKDPQLHLQMLEKEYPWDTVQMPMNAFDPHYRSFINSVLPVLLKRNIAPLAMKSMGDEWLLKSGVLQPKEALHFAWSLPAATVVSGMESLDLLKQNIGYAKDFKPMSAEEQQKLLARTAAAAADGEWEKYKTARTFDGWFGRKIHGTS